MRLYVGMLAPVQLFQAVDGNLLHLVDVLTTAVIPVRRVTFGVLVCKHATDGFQYGRRHKVFACNQLDSFLLAVRFAADSTVNSRILMSQFGILYAHFFLLLSQKI